LSPASPTLLVLQHSACEPPGVYEHELRERGVGFERVVAGEAPLPDWRAHAGIVVMGGAMGAYQEREHPWLAREKRLIAEAVAAGVPCWGVCLGAQLLAAALGARVAPGPAPEIGVLEVQLTPAAAADPVFAPAPRTFRSLQWHGDTYELPAGATQLARSAAYEQQAFVLGSAYGVQFHLEVDVALAELWAGIPDYAAELREHGGDGAPRRMVEEVRAAQPRTVPLARALFARWLTEVAGF
jgi:GMP synthase (glutamine-hydrolysing)